MSLRQMECSPAHPAMLAYLCAVLSSPASADQSDFRITGASPEDLPSVFQSRPLAGLTPSVSMASRYQRTALSPLRIDNRLGVDVAVALGLYGWVEFDAILPASLALTAMPGANAGEWKDGPAAMLGGVRLVGKIAIPGRRRAPTDTGGGMAVIIDAELPTAQGTKQETWLRPSLVLDERFKHGFLFSVNAGAEIRTVTDNIPLAAALTWAAAVVVPIVPAWNLSMFASVDASVPIVPLVEDWGQVRARALVGVRWLGKRSLSIDIAAGAGLSPLGGDIVVILRVNRMPTNSAEVVARRAPPKSPPALCYDAEDVAAAPSPAGRRLFASPAPPAPRSQPAAPELCPEPETVDMLRADAYAGSFIALRGVAIDLRERIAETRGRNLVWAKKKLLVGEHKFDWNPTLDHLAKVIDGDVDRLITRGLSSAAEVRRYYNDADDLAKEADRTAQVLRVIATYLSCIRASQYALHDAPRLVLGEGVGFTNLMIEDTAPLGRELDRLLAGKVNQDRIDAASAYALRDVERFFLGIEDGATALHIAGYISLASITLGIGKALIALTSLLGKLPQILAQIAEGGGGATLVAGTGSGGGAILYGGVANAAAIDIHSIIYGGSHALGSTMLLMAGGRGPVDVGKAGEAAVGLSGGKVRVKWPGFRTKSHVRVPDDVTRLTLTEVKNVLRLSWTRQLDDYLAFAQATGRTFTLYVRRSTTLSSEVKRYVARRMVKLEFIP